MRTHYPRTPHLPWSPGASSDDVRLNDLAALEGREIVVTEKLDGENTTLHRDGLHARSPDSGHHPSRALVKALHGRIRHLIPDRWRICGENVHAVHSLPYTALDGWFHVISVWVDDHCLDWDTTVRFASRVGLPVVPVLDRYRFDAARLRRTPVDTATREGYVVRTVDGFPRSEFPLRVAKWVRPAHVQTDRHWMTAPVVANGLGPSAALWEVRSGGPPSARDLRIALRAPTGSETGPGGGAGATVAGPAGNAPGGDDPVEARLAEVTTRLDLLGRTGDLRLAGVLAALLLDDHHSDLAARLVDRRAGALGPPLARRVADLVGLARLLHHPRPDEERRTGLARLSLAADLGVLHAVSAAALAGRDDPGATIARDQVDWSWLHATDAGLDGPTPLADLRTGLGEALVEAGVAPVARDRCWAEARAAWAAGRLTSAGEAVAATWRWRDDRRPELALTVGPSGSGKSATAVDLAAVEGRRIISLDDLREAAGSRASQRHDAGILRDALGQLDAALAAGVDVVWDATCLTPGQRRLVHRVGERHDATVVHHLHLVTRVELVRRNRVRRHPVPAGVLDAQVRRFRPPRPGEAHRILYRCDDGGVGDVDGALDDPFEAVHAEFDPARVAGLS